MSDKTEDLIASISINQILVSVLQEYGKLTVPTINFLDAKINNKELVVDYDDTSMSFVFSLREKIEEK